MKRYIKDRLHSLFKLNDPPHKLALAFAIGIFIAFSPTIGFHMISCVACGMLFRLNTLVIITASLLNNPWTMVPMYAFCIWFGIQITGADIATPSIAWNELTLTTAYLILKPYLWPYIAGTLIIGTLAGVISYFLFHWAVVRYRKMEKS
ncbi:MAG: DUF2062 domain-containing protein [Nitrospirota bacterium]